MAADGMYPFMVTIEKSKGRVNMKFSAVISSWVEGGVHCIDNIAVVIILFSSLSNVTDICFIAFIVSSVYMGIYFNI